MVREFKHVLSAAALAALLSACGGGGSSSATATVTGTAATGAAIAAGTVTLKCVSGSASSLPTGADGNFSVDISGVTLPCVGRVDYKDSSGTAQKLHTFISAAGNANITPVTELLVAKLTSGTAADAFDKFDATKAKTFTATQIKAAADAVKAYIKNTLGVDTTNLPDDPVGTKLAAKTSSSSGDKFDTVLDDLAAKLKSSGKKLADAAVELEKSGSTTGVGSTVLGNMVVTGIGSSARNGTYAPTAVSQASGVDTDVNGQTKDGNFEFDVVYTSGGAIKSAAIWFFNTDKSITFFGCNNGTISCGNLVGYEPLMKQILFNKAVLSQVTDPFATGGMTLVSGGEKIQVEGQLAAK
jgi:hypothetical protein